MAIYPGAHLGRSQGAGRKMELRSKAGVVHAFTWAVLLFGAWTHRCPDITAWWTAMCLPAGKPGSSSGSWPSEEPGTTGQGLWIPGRAVLKNNNNNDHHNWTSNEDDDHRILAPIL